MIARPLLGPRALGRALLHRQHLLARSDQSVLAMLEHLVGMQAQAPLAPYVGLWTRLDSLDPAELAELMTSRQAVRAWLMRSTIHLVSARDCHALRPLLFPVNESSLAGHFGSRLVGVDLAAVLRAGRDLLEERPRTRAELRSLLGQRWPDADAEALAFAVSYLAGLVQVPPRGIWGSVGPAALTTVESWLGPQSGAPASIDDVVRRYLAAYGPATVRDVQTWSGLTRLNEVVDRLELRVFGSDDGAELYDVPDAPLPDPDTPAPPRFLPEYDNILLSHADRRRIIHGGRRVPLPPGNGAAMGTVLLDGMFAATWRIRRDADRARLHVVPFATPPPAQADEITREGTSLLAFIAPQAVDQDVDIARPS
jgi:hypothetical protein